MVRSFLVSGLYLCLSAFLRQFGTSPPRSLFVMDPLPRRRKEGGGEIVEVYGFAGWIASLVAYGKSGEGLHRTCFEISNKLRLTSRYTVLQSYGLVVWAAGRRTMLGTFH